MTEEEIEFIRNTTIRDVILRTNPELNENDIQDNPFLWDTASEFYDRCEISKNLISYRQPAKS